MTRSFQLILGISLISGFQLVTFAAEPPASTKESVKTSPLGGDQVASAEGVQESDKPLQVNGQTRNLSMTMVLKNGNDDINFVEVRKNYHPEILGTFY